MHIRIRKFGLAAALAASALTASAPAMARDGYHDRGDDAAIAIGAGVIGLALGAALADHGDRHYYDRGYYDSRRLCCTNLSQVSSHPLKASITRHAEFGAFRVR